MRHVIYSNIEDDNIDYSSLNKKSRIETPAYINRFNTTFYCSCNNVPLRLSSDGRFYNKPGELIKHSDDCDRNIKKYKRVNLDAQNPEVVISYSSLFGSKNKSHPSGYANDKDRSLMPSIRHFSSLSFVYPLAKYTYNTLSEENKNFSLDDYTSLFHSKLKSIHIKNRKNASLDGQLIFRCGKFESAKQSKYSEDKILVYYKALNKTLYSIIDRDSFIKASRDFIKAYKKELDPKLNLMFISISDLKTKKSRLLFYPISNKGLPCDSFLEQRFYNWLENVIVRLNGMYFKKDDYDSIYDDEFNNHFKDDGQICSLDKSVNKKLVIEIFGMLTNEEYKEKAQIKKEYLEANKNVVMLQILPEDNEKVYFEKLKIALNELKRMDV